MQPGTLEAMAGWWAGLPPRAGAVTVLAVEGRSGSGKSTLGAALARLAPDAVVVAMDEIYPGWDGLAAGVRLLVTEVLRPLAAGLPVGVPRWDWTAGGPAAPRVLPPARLVLLEGIGCGARDCAPYLSALVWLEASEQVRRHRALTRDGDVYAPHWDGWAAQEEAYLATEDPRSRADLILDTEDRPLPQAPIGVIRDRLRVAKYPDSGSGPGPGGATAGRPAG